MTNAQRVAKLRRLARRWGGDIVMESLQERNFTFNVILDRIDISVAPFNGDYGVDWAGRRVLVNPRIDINKISVPALIHELGHIFASPRPPHRAIEPNWFGWEYLVARWVGGVMGEWCKFHRDYGLGDLYFGQEFGTLTMSESRIALDNAIVRGQKCRNITMDRKPRSMRRGARA